MILRILLPALTGLTLLSSAAWPQGLPCSVDGAWRHVREAYPIHVQVIGKCENRQTGEQVIIVTEPPAHLVRGKIDGIVRALFSAPVVSVHRRRGPDGFDGWVEDLAIVVNPKTPDQMTALSNDLTVLATLVFGSSYKAEIQDIARMTPAPLWEAPQAIEVSAEELYNWLLSPTAERLIPLDGGTPASLRERTDRGEIGAFQTAAPGLVVALLPSGSSSNLNIHVDELRRFAVDTDAFLGAIRVRSDRVALIGRERTTSMSAMPPMRVDTILLLASQRSVQLMQSYERNRPYAGKLLSESGNLFGWDWAPILLSDELIDTEFGSVLNYTDNMLKGWSESGKVQYNGFPHAYPGRYPFGTAGAFQTIAGKGGLTYNWNTAGVGFVSRKDTADIFTVRNTGSLPVSYFPEGAELEGDAKTKLVQAEDQAYKYFSTLRNPLLGRAVQYAALYQVFQAFGVRSKPPHDQAPATASITAVERILQERVLAALDVLSRPATPSSADYLLFAAYVQFGASGQSYENRRIPEIDEDVKKLRSDIAATIATLDRDRPNWRADYAVKRATGMPLPGVLGKTLEDLNMPGLSLVQPPDQVRRLIVNAMERDPEGWIRTPAIVVSRGEMRTLTGGHNIGGRATRIEIDAAVPKGTVSASGTYSSGRVLRVNPEDAPASRDLVRLFDREVGLSEANVSKGVRAVERGLVEKSLVARPARNMAAALERAPGAARPFRGAEPQTNAISAGYRPGTTSPAARAQVEALAERSQAQIVIARVDEGYAVFQAGSQPSMMIAPNHTSLLSALDSTVRKAALGPPPISHPKLAFFKMTAEEPQLILRTLSAKTQAAGGAGGKPPFSGNSFSLGEAPQPGQNFWKGQPPKQHVDSTMERGWDRVMGVFGKKRQRIHVEGREAERLLGVKPKWDDAVVEFPTQGSTVFAHGPDFGNAAVHAVEVRVPVTVESGGLKSMVVDALASFRDALSPTRTQEVNTAVGKLFKGNSGADVSDALVRYKTMMIDEFGSQNIWIRLRQEGADIIVTEAQEGEGRRGG